MMELDIARMFPKMILRDQNGYALAKALKAGLDMFLEIIEQGRSIAQDVDSMPEWRLDEMAWETGVPYDYGADISAKREWIRNARSTYSGIGTVGAIRRLLAGYIDNVNLLEWWTYGAMPYHYWLILDGDYTPETEAWVRRVSEMAGNLRSVQDDLNPGAWEHVPYYERGQVMVTSGLILDGTIRAGEETL